MSRLDAGPTPRDQGASSLEDAVPRLVAGTGETVWIVVGTLLDGLGAPPLSNAHLVYDRDTIRHVGGEDSLPAREVVRPGQVEPDIRLSNCTVLPGLLEAHAHLVLEGGALDPEVRRRQGRQRPELLLEGARRRARALPRLGVVAVRDAGDKRGVGLGLTRESRDRTGPAALPLITSPGPAIHHQGAYGAFFGEPLEDHPSPEACVASRHAAGAQRVKLMVSGLIDFQTGQVDGPPQMSAAEVRRLVSAARSRGLPAFAHASGATSIEHALAGDIESVEHGFFVTPDQLSIMRDRQIAWVPTFAPVRAQLDHATELEWDETATGHLRRILEGHATSLRLAVEKGVTVLAGSDSGSYGVPHGEGLLRELEIMEEAGMRSLDVVSAATGVSARHLDLDEHAGVLRPGELPRLILAEGDPLETVAHLRKGIVTLFDGQVLPAPESLPGL